MFAELQNTHGSLILNARKGECHQSYKIPMAPGEIHG